MTLPPTALACIMLQKLQADLLKRHSRCLETMRYCRGCLLCRHTALDCYTPAWCIRCVQQATWRVHSMSAQDNLLSLVLTEA